MKINEKGFWENPSAEGHAYDRRLAIEIVKLMKAHKFESVLDLGCGMADYSRQLQAQKFYVMAYDGNPNTPALTKGLGAVADLSQPFSCGQRVDAVISLEVGEHIPAEFEQNFLNNIVDPKPKLVLLSWAIPGQDGDGHVNCQPNEYIMQQMLLRGYSINLEASRRLRKASSLWWFKNTLMVFEL